MKNMYNDLEGLRIAIEIESRGLEFYRQARDNAVNQKEQDLFSWLMNEETRHEEAFRNMFNQLKDTKEAHSDEYLFDEEISRYLTVLAEFHVFPPAEKAKQKISELKTLRAILEVSMQAEKDSVLFYDELANNSKFPDAKKVFLALKAEEQTHVVRLRSMIESWT